MPHQLMNHGHIKLVAVLWAVDHDVSNLLFDIQGDMTQGVFQFKWAGGTSPTNNASAWEQ